jgi:hypothetical protein
LVGTATRGAQPREDSPDGSAGTIVADAPLLATGLGWVKGIMKNESDCCGDFTAETIVEKEPSK